jgi:hypothetical protein
MTRFQLIALAGWMMATPAFAAGSTAPLPPADPTAANATPREISQRAMDACLVTQARLMGTTRDAVHGQCSCYANRTVARMSKEEIGDFRRTGYFDDTTRAKALESIDFCKLKRPI